MERHGGSLETLTVAEYLELAPELSGLADSIEGTALELAEEEPGEPPPARRGLGDPVVLTVTREQDYLIVRGDGDEVRFAYWGEPRTTADGRVYDDPYNLDNYQGGKRGLMSSGELAAVGYSPSELAAAFLERGAGALIAALWSVGDEAARHFAEAFYEGLLDRQDITSATLAAGKAARRLGDPAWLAYAVYADPHGRLVP